MKKYYQGLAVFVGLLVGAHLAMAACLPKEKTLPVSVDMKAIRETWLGWNNELREKAGLSPYELNEELDYSAIAWSETALKRGNITHKRDGQKAYYDYKKIGAWFKGLGLEFKNVNKITFTENIGWGVYKCPADANADCTEQMKKAIRTTFDFFLKEKGKKYRPHYNSLMKNEFRKIGVGLTVDEKKHRYYLTIHYATELINKPLETCGE